MCKSLIILILDIQKGSIVDSGPFIAETSAHDNFYFHIFYFHEEDVNPHLAQFQAKFVKTGLLLHHSL